MSDNRFDEGLKIRREILGSAHVDKSISEATEFSMPLQKLVTEYAWGTIWTRPGLSRKTRSMLSLATFIALNNSHEFKVHLVGAINNGVTRDEIIEIILQSAVYCGVPAAIDSIHIAEEVFR